jgi:hypothetical protein
MSGRRKSTVWMRLTEILERRAKKHRILQQYCPSTEFSFAAENVESGSNTFRDTTAFLPSQWRRSTPHANCRRVDDLSSYPRIGGRQSHLFLASGSGFFSGITAQQRLCCSFDITRLERRQRKKHGFCAGTSPFSHDVRW